MQLELEGPGPGWLLAASWRMGWTGRPEPGSLTRRPSPGMVTGGSGSRDGEEGTNPGDT